MPTFADSFSLAYSLHVVGTYFDGAAMLAHVGSLDSEGLKEVCTAQLENLGQQGQPTRWHIRRVENILVAAGVEKPNMPQNPDDYPQWVDAVTGSFYPLLADEESAVSGYSLGWYLGSYVENANLAAFALMLKDEEADNKVVIGHLEEVAVELREAADGFGAYVEAQDDDASLTALLNAALKHIQGAPALDDPNQEPLDIADDYQEVLFELGVVVEKMDAALT